MTVSNLTMEQADAQLAMRRLQRLMGFVDDEEAVDINKLHSRYWMSQLPSENQDLISLASYRRAIAKFVRIATGRDDIDVRFSSGDQSYATNPEKHKVVVISARIRNHEFDAVVGMALHEAYHILKSDFDIIDWIGQSKLTDEQRQELGIQRLRYDLPSHFYTLADDKNVDHGLMYKWLGEVLNFVEDRRIDDLAYTENPGYQEYYIALYKKYWVSDIIGIGLQSSSFRKLNWSSYDFRMTNMVSPHTDPTALPDLDKIIELTDLQNIDRLITTKDAADVAVKILGLILKNIDPIVEEDEQKSDDDDENEDEKKEEKKEKSNDNENDTEENEEDNEEEQEIESELPNLDQMEREELEEAIENQKKFIQNIIEKMDLSEEDINRLDAIEKSGTTIEHVAGDHETGLDVIVVRKLTKEVLETIDGLRTYGMERGSTHSYSVTGIKKGIVLGRLLQNRLQVRNEDRKYHSKRKTAGHIDRRMLYNIGMGNTSIFQTIKTDKFGDALIHISVDASGSMDGDEWTETMTAITALAYATEKIKNLDIIVSFRTTGHLNDDLVPVMVIGYDSRVDSFAKIRNLFPFIEPNGLTPEGLCYLATMKDILESVKGKTGYFINFSDGYPNMSHNGKSAVQLTTEAVNEMRRNGIRVLSFFIGCGDFGTFRRMYGKDSKQISVTDVVPLAWEINKILSTMK